jgi:AraC family transcriptional regulator, regulatory protein of adaptative response / methylated-DNA-[protein]-cysteine methyltransferase
MEHLVHDYQQLSEDYHRIEQAILFLEANYKRQPTLKEIAENAHLSEYHFQRLFTRWAGISPKRFLQFLTKESAMRLLDESGSLLEAAYQSGLSGMGRLHDLFVSCEAVTPGEYKRRGEGLAIHYGFHKTPFGECLLAYTGRGICGLDFIDPGGQGQAQDALKARWQQAEVIKDQAGTRPYIQRIFGMLESPSTGSLPLYLNGTNFQIKVWEALLRIPAGRVVSYQAIANYLGAPRAARAVGQAVARNPIMYLIPCHRVIRSLGEFGDYRGGAARKKALLGWEMSHSEAGSLGIHP